MTKLKFKYKVPSANKKETPIKNILSVGGYVDSAEKELRSLYNEDIQINTFFRASALSSDFGSNDFDFYYEIQMDSDDLTKLKKGLESFLERIPFKPVATEAPTELFEFINKYQRKN